MKFIYFLRSVFILLLSFSSLLFATQFDNPYQGNIVVQHENEDQLKALALKQVLVKVSGNVDIDKLDETQLLVKNLNSILSQYGYQEFDNINYFTARFDKTKINQALKEMQQPIWGDTRPTTLVWLIEDSPTGRELISDHMINRSSTSELSETLQTQQHNRGIDLQFPLMDLDDSLALSPSDIAGRFYKPIAMASQRYGVNHFVVANLKQNSDQKWSLKWELLKFDSQTMRNAILFSDKMQGDKATLLTSMVSHISDYYVSQYAVLENQGEKFSQTIYVNGVNSLAELVQLNKLLANLLAIASFEVTSVEDSQVTVDIKINGGLLSFKNALFAQSNLQADLSQSDEFHFNWR